MPVECRLQARTSNIFSSWPPLHNNLDNNTHEEFNINIGSDHKPTDIVEAVSKEYSYAFSLIYMPENTREVFGSGCGVTPVGHVMVFACHSFRSKMKSPLSYISFVCLKASSL